MFRISATATITIPLGIFVAQRHAQMAERKAKSALSGVGVVADQMRHAQYVAEAAIAEARSVRSEVESKVAELMHRADASTANAMNVLSSRVDQMTAQTEVQMSCAAAEVKQQLGKEIEAAATSMATTAEINTRIAVKGMRCNIQAQIE